MGEFIDRDDLSNAFTPTTLIAIFDDDGDQVADDAPIAAVIERAEGMVNSFLINYARPFPEPTDPLIRAACVDFAVAYSFERHPEYVRSFGEDKRASHWKRAVDIMKRVQAAIQQPPAVLAAGTKPSNVGGVVVDNGPRVLIDSADGTKNGGLF